MHRWIPENFCSFEIYWMIEKQRDLTWIEKMNIGFWNLSFVKSERVGILEMTSFVIMDYFVLLATTLESGRRT